ncbi:DNA lyase [Pectobacterium parmentieri]|uniref:8-oxoguanine DNA glycosylase n=1 Tax=Pectobacterium parmentieri TaxID=1905730 RepID=UPI000EB24805|nr:DNA lyase [Pectobacterium parmentieri]AYH00931.1 DNA lyase [Pectobacterium parmentieri]
MNTYTPEALSRAVKALCADLRTRIECGLISDERYLWWELSCCILSSQVPYSLAIAAADIIDTEQLLHNSYENSDELLIRLYEVLRTPLDVEGKKRNYRFPKVKAEQLAATHAAVAQTGKSLKSLISSDANYVRTWLVANAHGLGPKQASMFLRNCGATYDLAILDRHVLEYMSALGIYSGGQSSISGLNQYGKYENKLRDHAEQMNCQVGLLDWAIWIVMRVAKRNNQEKLA